MSPQGARRAETPANAIHARRGLIGVAVGALLASACTVLVMGTTDAATVSGHSEWTNAVPTRIPSAAEQVFAKSATGDCLTWSTPSASDLTRTDCASPHRFEVASAVDLSTQFAPGSPLPDAAALTHLRDSLCTPAVNTYLRGRFDPRGLFSVGLIDPGEASWRAGQRTVRCGLQHVGVSGEQFPIQGRVSDLDQSDVAPVGSCENISATLPADPVDCALPHASEVISVVDLGQKFPAAYPAIADQDTFLDETCRAAADAVLGAPDAAATKGLTVFWGNLQPESWAAGSRRVNCSVGKQLSGGGFAPTTGAARSAPAAATTVPKTTVPTPTKATPTTAGR